MSNLGPGDKPKVVRKRAARARRQRRVQQQTANAAPLSARPVRPKQVPRPPSARTVQQRTQNARPLSSKPVRPKQVVRPLAQKPPRKVTAAEPPEGPRDVRKIQRGAAVHGYDQLSRRQKQARVREAQRRIKSGKADESDRAVAHIHATRVQGTRKIAAAQKAMEALGAPRPHEVAYSPDTARLAGILKLPHDQRLTEPDAKGVRIIRDAKGKETGRTAPVKGAKAGSVADASGLTKVVRAVGKASSEGWKSIGAPKVIQNAPTDIAELAVTTPSSIAKLATTTATHPKKVPGMLAAPYKELAKDPKKFITERPVSAALMVAPAVRAPGRAAGRVARAAGKQTLERPAATLPHTTLKEARTGSRGAVTRAVQAKRDVKRGAPEMTQAQVQRRVDEFYDLSKQQVQRTVVSAGKEAKRRGMTKEAAAEHVKGAKGGAHDHQVRRMFAREFGAPHVRTDEGTIVRPHGAASGALHNSEGAAEAVTRHLNEQAASIKRGSHGPHQTARRNADVPHEFQTVDAGYGQFASVPKAAAERLHKHQVVGSSKAPGAQYMRVAGRSFRGTVLPLSARWLFGQVGEAGARSAVVGAGPFDAVRFNRVVREMNKVRPGSGEEFAARVHGGQFDLTGTAREFADGKSLAEELKGTAVEDLAHGVSRVARTAPLKKVRGAWNAYSRVVFDVINGQIETRARQAMAGQAIRQGPLMEGRLLGLTDKAIHDAARGLRGTEAQVATARAVDRMYGQYQKFSPEKREHLLHTTPFYPWYRNTVTFLTQTLPVDHPLKAALVADLDAATEEWRKAHGLSLRQGGRKPGFLLGTYPVGKKGQTVPAGRYLPFVPGEPLQAVGDLFLPQYANVQDILRGRDWKGDEVKAKDVPKELASSVVEAHVPGVAQAQRVIAADSVRKGVLHELAPFPRTKAQKSRKRGTEIPGLELTPLQLQQLQVP